MQGTEMPKPRSNTSITQVTPNPELKKRTRRKFNADYKLLIIAEADSCEHGELGGILHRQKLYSNQLADWRREYAEYGVKGLSKSSPGPVPSKTPDQKRIAQLEKDNARLSRKLNIANGCMKPQKKH